MEVGDGGEGWRTELRGESGGWGGSGEWGLGVEDRIEG